MENSGKSWQGYDKMDKLFILFVTNHQSGDSYSSVLPLLATNWLPSPTSDLPLGIPFPGSTYTDNNSPNWVGHLVKTWAPEKRLLIYNFAQGGDTIGNMKYRIEAPYKELVTTKCKPGEHWSPANSLFAFWIGINDFGSLRSLEVVETLIADLFDCAQTVYDTGARAFLFIDLPPIDRIPFIAMIKGRSQRIAPLCAAWNKCLGENVKRFSDTHPGAKCFGFSSYDCLNGILEEPVKHGFTKEDATECEGGIWADSVHLTGTVHEIIAQDLWRYLMTI